MSWHASSERVALHRASSSLLRSNGVTLAKVERVVSSLGFSRVHVDGLTILRDCIGVSRYRRGAHPSQAPSVVDCSVLAKWWYAQHGIQLRRYAVDQRDQGTMVPEDDAPRLGDLVFSAGLYARFRDDPANGVGHVGICTGEGTVIHAASSKVDVIEVPYKMFAERGLFRGRYRILPRHGMRVYSIPSNRCVEHTDDLIWLILQSL